MIWLMMWFWRKRSYIWNYAVALPPPTEIFEVLMLYLMLHSLSLTKIKACIISESSLIFTCLARANCFHFVFHLMRDF